MNENFDAARLTLLLSELRLPATKQIWARFAEQSDKCVFRVNVTELFGNVTADSGGT